MPASPYKTIEMFDPETGGWSDVTSLPDKHGYAWPGVLAQPETGKIFVICGLTTADGDSFVSSLSTKVSAYDTVLGNWINCADLDAKGRACFGCAMLDKKIYIAGGTDGTGISQNANVYNTVSNQWSQLATMPEGRVHFQMSVVGDKLWAIGGKSARGVCADMLSYDPAADSWTTCPGLSPARANTAQASLGPYIFVFGGSMAEDESVVDSVDRYDLHTQSWTKITTLPFKRKQMMAVAAVQ
eukprot:TRINITY_DN19096_c0_g1_i2.p2 TRINITY_DN19096_c0_g1~~TRINITY_DN19096_c0_g1_i2.p2  ORF type:complete len:242 (-),score=58.75 TRINITY_DN19096_c0_g1_i2:304-1029(-)